MKRFKLSIDQQNDIKELAPKFTRREIAVKLNLTYEQVRVYCKRKNIKAVHGSLKIENIPPIKILPSPYVVPGLITAQLTIEQINAMRNKIHEPPLKTIFLKVCEYYDVDIEIAKSKYRGREFAWARQVYYWIASKFTKQTLKIIGRLTCCRDHTTVVHGRETVSDIIKFDKDREREVREIAGIIKNIGLNVIGYES